MNRHVALLGTGLLLAAAGQAQAQAIQLGFTPQVGQVTRYRMWTRMWSAGDTTAAPAMQMSMYQTQTVTGMDGANYVVKNVTDSTVMAGGGGRPGGGMDMMRGMTVTNTMDPRGHVVSTQVTPPPGMPAFLANMMTKNAGSGDNPRNRVWPEGAISPGATWTDSMTVSTGQGRNRQQVVLIVTYKFERLDHQGGDRIAVITLNGTNAGASITGEMDVDLDASRMAHMVTDMTQGQQLTRMNMEMLP